MKSEIIRHGYMFFTGKERPHCPECTFQNIKFIEAGAETVKVKKKEHQTKEDGEIVVVVVGEEDVKVEYAIVECSDCGCRFKVAF